jgi:hypothetical protein
LKNYLKVSRLHYSSLLLENGCHNFTVAPRLV